MTSTAKPGLLQVKNWAKFQHYHDRNPPWIKLSTDVFQNPEFSSLSGASKLLAICIWTLASKSPDSELGAGSVPDDYTFITRWGFLETRYIKPKHLEELVNKGFLVRTASKSLAKRKQSARAEAETETYKQETEGEREAGAKNAPPSRADRGTRLPVDFKVTDTHREWATTNNLPDPDSLFEDFCDHYRANGTAMKDWDATFRSWIRKEPKLYHRGGKGNGKTSAFIAAIRNSNKSPL